MKIAIMQPYFFPYIGYYSLIRYCDKFLFFDTPQYINRGWVNRNRIMSQNGKTTYITVPIEHTGSRCAIKDTVIANNRTWKKRIMGQLTVYKRKAPNYVKVMSFLDDAIDEEETSLSRLNCKTIKMVCNYLGINCDFEIVSEMDLNISCVMEPDEWALNISKALDADIYVNLPGGMSFFDRKKYEREGIELRFLQNRLKPYVQRTGSFISGLSIIDVMMFCSNLEIISLLDDFDLI